MSSVTNVDDIIYEIFNEHRQYKDTNLDIDKRQILPSQLRDVGDYLDSVLASLATKYPQSLSDYTENRIGPVVTSLDLSSSTGRMQVGRFDYSGMNSFNTARTDVCVFRGKWEYEVLLESRGVMQFGWCTIKCHFSQETGVGDTWTSFSYDGGRVRKWNVHNSKYGEPWLAGDVISCLVDCDMGTVSFKRNGVDLGVAFENIPYGRGIAYFPAISLSQNERVQINFGGRPLRHPTEGYLPIDEKPTLMVEQSLFLLTVLEQIIHLASSSRINGSFKTSNSFKFSSYRSMPGPKREAILMIITQNVVDRLAPLMTSAYVIHHCFIPMLFKLNYDSFYEEQTEISLCLDYLWAFLETDELHSILTQLFISLNLMYYFEPNQVTLDQQRRYLHLLQAILKHEDTRKLALESIFFRHVKLPLFIDIKPPDSEILKQMIPDTWSKNQVAIDEIEKVIADMPACQKLKHDVILLENLQIEILKLLLNPHDVLKKSTSSKSLFLPKFRTFLRESLTESPIHNYQPGVIRNLFHRLMQVLEYYWLKYHEAKSSDEGPEFSLAFDAAYIPSLKFIDNHFDYFNLQRLGGVQSHLEKEYSADLKRARATLSTPNPTRFPRSTFEPTSINPNFLETRSIRDVFRSRDRSQLNIDSSLKSPNATGSDSLTELLDGLIILYHIGVHKNYMKICEVIDSLREYNDSLQDINSKLSNCQDNCEEIRDELLRSKKIFEQQAEDLTRKIIWIHLNVFSQEKRRDVVNLHRCLQRTLDSASTHAPWFSFVPEIYLNDVYLNTFMALNVFYQVEDTTLQREMSIEFVNFLANHIQDTRIINTDVRDNMVQALSSFSYYSGSMKALESMRQANQIVLIRALLTPNANRAWAMTNILLVRFWKGCGFGFRYSQNYASKLLLSLRKDRIQDPSPSEQYQKEIGRHLENYVNEAIDYLNSLLSHLNWAFSEFMGTLRELVPNKSRTSVNLESRHMKICSTCFDISVSLLRTIEMIINIAPRVILDENSSKSEMILVRLLQLISQIINRLATKNYILEEIDRLKIFILDNVHPYPIFSAVCGILICLITRGNDQLSSRICRMLLKEADLDITCLYRLIYGAETEQPNEPSSNHFKLISHSEINRNESNELEDLYKKLNETYLKLAKTKDSVSADDDSMCIICYCHQIQGEFRPCKHQACFSCIHMHFMTSNECFFCKTRIETVVDPITGQIIDGLKPNENSTKEK